MRQLTLDIGLTAGPTLDNFLAGPNVQALQHLQLWLADPGNSNAVRSPVSTYLWGPGGSGKTHLLRAVASALSAGGSSVGWLDAQVREPAAYADHWVAVILDEVHLYDPGQQQCAFSWFVQAQAQQRAVLAAGALPPADLALREDLRSRLGWGHVFAMRPLEESERRAVLRQAADARGVFLGDEVMDFMLRRFSRDLGSLMELLDLIDAYAMQTQRAITVPLIKSMMDQG